MAKQKILNVNNIPIVCVFFLFSFFNIIYIYSLHINVLWQAGFFHLSLLEKFFNNNLTFTDLLVPFGEHGLFGYNLLFIFNAIFLKLNMIFDAYVIWISIIISTIFIFLGFSKSLKPLSSSIFIQLLFIPIALIMFNLTQGNGQAMDVQVRVGVALIVPVIFCVDRFFFGNNSLLNKLVVYSLVALTLLIFGTAYTFSLIPVVLLMYALQYLRNGKIKFSSLDVLLVVFVCTILYGYIFISPYSNNSPNTVLLSIKYVFNSPINSFKFILAAISASTYGSTSYVHYFHSQGLLIFNGILLFIFYIHSLRQYLLSGMWKITYMPVALIILTFSIILLVLLGRNGGNSWEWPAATWYITHYKYGLAGMVWILIYSMNIKHKDASLFKKIKTSPLNFGIILYIVVGLMISNVIEIKHAKYIKGYFAAIVPYAFVAPGQIPVDDNGYTPFINKYEPTLEGLRIMRKYNLNVYYDHKPYKW